MSEFTGTPVPEEEPPIQTDNSAKPEDGDQVDLDGEELSQEPTVEYEDEVAS